MKKLTILSTSVALAAALALSGCGGSSGSSSPTEEVVINGEAMDPELSGATVCLDTNNNRICDVNEPSGKTDGVGHYLLTITTEQHHACHSLVVFGGTDIGTDLAFSGKLTAIKNAGQTIHNISPLTTMVEARYQHCQLHQKECQANAEEIKSEFAAHVELQEEEINSNIVTLANNGQEEALKVALSFQKSAEIFNPDDPLEFYRLVAHQGFESGKTWRENIDSVVETSPNAAKIHALVTTIMRLNVGDAHDLAHQVADEIIRINPKGPINPLNP